MQVDLGKVFLVAESNDMNQNTYIVEPYSAFRPAQLKDKSPLPMAYLTKERKTGQNNSTY